MFTVERRGALWKVSEPGGAAVGWHSNRRDAHVDAVDRYAAHLTRDDHAVIRAELVGRDLACWCPLVYRGKHAELDLPCHADVLLTIAAGDERTSHRRGPNVTDPSLRSDVVDDDPTFDGEDDA